jgi:hypothetical protein
MADINEFFRILGSLPVWALVTAVVLTAFGLAGYAIYAVLSVAKERNESMGAHADKMDPKQGPAPVPVEKRGQGLRQHRGANGSDRDSSCC